MPNIHRRAKVLLALLATVGSLLAPAPPASAATTLVTWTLSAHVLTHWNTATSLYGDASAGPCDVGTGAHPRVATHVNTDTHALHITGASAYSGFESETTNWGGTNYRLTLIGAPQTTTGSFDPTTNTVTQNIALRYDFRSCDGATLLCTYTVTGHLSGHDYAGGTTPATGDTVTLQGSMDIATHIGCNAAIRSVILGSTMVYTWHLTAH